jgi:hypothetical protein
MLVILVTMVLVLLRLQVNWLLVDSYSLPALAANNNTHHHPPPLASKSSRCVPDAATFQATQVFQDAHRVSHLLLDLHYNLL